MLEPISNAGSRIPVNKAEELDADAIKRISTRKPKVSPSQKQSSRNCSHLIINLVFLANFWISGPLVSKSV